eukprot:6198240-Pleurochrysis_carterae.AAC.4
MQTSAPKNREKARSRPHKTDELHTQKPGANRTVQTTRYETAPLSCRSTHCTSSGRSLPRQFGTCQDILAAPRTRGARTEPAEELRERLQPAVLVHVEQIEQHLVLRCPRQPLPSFVKREQRSRRAAANRSRIHTTNAANAAHTAKATNAINTAATAGESADATAAMAVAAVASRFAAQGPSSLLHATNARSLRATRGCAIALCPVLRPPTRRHT